MSGRDHPVLALVAFELRRRLREPATLLAALALVGILVAGHVEYWSALPPRPEDDRMFGYAFIAAVLASLRFGLAEDRALGLDEFLTANLVSPLRYLTARILTGAAVVLAIGSAGFVLALALSGLELVYAVWYATLFTLAAWTFLPAVLLVELAVETRFAGLVVFIGLLVTLLVLEPFHGAAKLNAWLGHDVERFAFRSLGPLTLRAAIATGLLAALAPLIARRLRGGAARTAYE